MAVVTMRRTAIVVAVMVTVLLVAPSVGAQCKPDCGEPGSDDLVNLLAGSLWVDTGDLTNDRTPEMSTGGPVLP